MPPGDLGQPGHPANASPHKAALEESCRPFEQAANEVCGNDRPCKDEVLLNLDYDFRSCLKRWDQDGSGSPGSLGTPSINTPTRRTRTRCVPLQKAQAKPKLRGVWQSNNPENDSSERQDAAPGSPVESDLITIIVSKLTYLFGKATGDAKNIQRSKEMLRSLERIGLNDSPKNREHVKSQLKGVMKNPSAVAKIQTNGRIVKESILAGPRGVIKMISIWDKGRLITVLFTRS